MADNHTTSHATRLLARAAGMRTAIDLIMLAAEAECDAIMAMSDDEVRAMAERDGINVEAVASKGRAMVEHAYQEAQRRKKISNGQ